MLFLCGQQWKGSYPFSCMLVDYGPSQESSKEAMEMRCYRKILCISYKDCVTNEEVCAKIQQAIRPHKDLQTIVRDANCSGKVKSSVHQAWPKPSCKAQ